MRRYSRVYPHRGAAPWRAPPTSLTWRPHCCTRERVSRVLCPVCGSRLHEFHPFRPLVSRSAAYPTCSAPRLRAVPGASQWALCALLALREQGLSTLLHRRIVLLGVCHAATRSQDTVLWLSSPLWSRCITSQVPLRNAVGGYILRQLHRLPDAARDLAHYRVVPCGFTIAEPIIINTQFFSHGVWKNNRV